MEWKKATAFGWIFAFQQFPFSPFVLFSNFAQLLVHLFIFLWEISFSTHKLFRNSFAVLWLLLLVYSVADRNFSTLPPFCLRLFASYRHLALFLVLFHFFLSLEIGDNICNRHIGESNARWVLLPAFHRQWQANQKITQNQNSCSNNSNNYSFSINNKNNNSNLHHKVCYDAASESCVQGQTCRKIMKCAAFSIIVIAFQLFPSQHCLYLILHRSLYVCVCVCVCIVHWELSP